MNVATRYGIEGATAQAVSASIEGAIRRGVLGAGDAIPPVRALAEALAISPNTVASAYRALGQRGVVVGQGRRGTRVAERPPVQASISTPVPDGLVDLTSGNPDPALLPKLPKVRSAVAALPRVYNRGTVDAPELCDLARGRFERAGVHGDDVLVLGGALDAIERVLGAHLRTGDRVAMEDPGFPPLADLLRALGLVPVPAAIDERGMVPRALAAVIERGAAAVVFTPRAQNPTGAAFDDERAGELRAVLAAHPGVLVIEDDHAGPVAGAPPVSVCAPPPTDRWAVVASVSKWLGPDLRVAVLTGDADTTARVAGRRALGAGWVSTVLQTLVVDLWRSATAMRTVARAADTYQARREALIGALSEHGIAAQGGSGLNVWVPVGQEAPVLGAARDAGFALAPGERFRLAAGPGVRVSVGALQHADIAAVATAIASAAAPSGRSHHATAR